MIRILPIIAIMIILVAVIWRFFLVKLYRKFRMDHEKTKEEMLKVEEEIAANAQGTSTSTSTTSTLLEPKTKKTNKK